MTTLLPLALFGAFAAWKVRVLYHVRLERDRHEERISEPILS